MKIEEIKEKYRKLDSSLYGEKNIENSLGMLYHENSKFTEVGFRVETESIEKFASKYIAERSSQPFKQYPGAKAYDLNPYGQSAPQKSLLESLTQRRSVREYDKEYKISLNELALLLFQSYGITAKSKIKMFDLDGHIGMRNVPSGGALYPLEIYVAILNSHIDSGLYHYRIDNNSLELVKEGLFTKQLLRMIHAEPYVELSAASAVIFTTGLIERLIIKYGDRGYRFLMIEVGMVGQTISLLAESVNLGSCMLGGFYDDKLNDFLGIDGVFEAINNVIIIGKKKTYEYS